MRLLLLILFGIVFQTSHGETIREWVDAAPKADVTFTPWDGDLPNVNPGRDNAPLLPEGFYGYLDLSRISPDVFPVKLRLFYESAVADDSTPHKPGIFNQLKDSAAVGQSAVIEETAFTSPQEAQSTPIWNSPLPIKSEQAEVYVNQTESVRAEILSRRNEVIGRLSLGVCSLVSGTPRAIIVNNSGAIRAFADANYRVVSEVKRLVPDSYAYMNIETIWIDSATATDTGLNDVFWQRILLGGTTVAGLPGDIEILSKRLGVASNEPTLLGSLVAAQSPTEYTQGHGTASQGVADVSLDVKAGDNPFAFSIKIGEAMRQQLLRFSEFYLGIFVALQVAVIAVAFFGLRGSRRVWLWLIVPGFALVYTITGIVLSQALVRARADVRVSQVQIEREGWPDAILLSHIDGLHLAEKDSTIGLPVNTRPLILPSVNYSYRSFTHATFTFQRSLDAASLIIHAPPAVRVGMDVRSVVDYKPPCTRAADGRLNIERGFLGAWFWDGANWHNLGRVGAGMQVDWKSAKIILPLTTKGRMFLTLLDSDDFPAFLKPLLAQDFLKPLSTAGEGIFLGVEPMDNIQIDKGPNDRLSSRRVLAYQFHLAGGFK